jgi:uncharacterized membrane protein
VPGATFTWANGINDVGQIVGAYSDTGGGHGFLFDQGIYTTIDGPGAVADFGTQAYGINDSGQIVSAGAQNQPLMIT